MKIIGKPEVFLGFSMIFEGFLVSEGSKIMKIKENSDKGGKERLGEQENKANRAFKATERGPEVPREEGKRAQKGHECHWGRNKCTNFGGPGPPLSILDTKIQRKQNRRN